MIMAGGRGERLAPLTKDRSKPAVPFAGSFRIIDFTLSNCINSGLYQICLLPQYKSLSLDRHVDMAWKPMFQRELGQFLQALPPQKRFCEDWYRGTADAIYQNIYSIEQSSPDEVLILAGDHIYAMDYRKLIAFHRDHDADVTVGAIRVPVSEAANQLGVLQVNDSNQVTGFQEKPAVPLSIPGQPSTAFASMGIYLFRTDFLVSVLKKSASELTTTLDFGNDILPDIIARARVMAYSFQSGCGKSEYWKDVGTIETYFEASMDLLNPISNGRFDSLDWPIRSFRPNLPPARFCSGHAGTGETQLRNSIVCPGSILTSASVASSIIGFSSHVNSGSRIEESVLMGDVRIGRDVRLRRVIVDKNTCIPDGVRIGFNPLKDKDSGLTVTENGITVVPRGHHFKSESVPKNTKAQNANLFRNQVLAQPVK